MLILIRIGISGYGIGGGFGENVLIFGVDMSSSGHIDNKKKDILVLVKEPTQGLEHTLTIEKMYSINFNVTKNKFYLSLHYNRANSYLFVNGKEIVKFRAKDSEIVLGPLCLGNVSKVWSADNMKKTGLNGYVYEFNVDYIDFNDININKNTPIIHGYLTSKYDMI